ncbi:MAG: sensor histidine kinase [Phenylobacterium sp.]|nr:sensor histidine kinase [Phenylobacterium sp.]
MIRGRRDLSDLRQLNLAWACAVALLALGLVLGVRTEIAYRHQAERQAAVQADILAASVSAALAFDDGGAMRQYVDALRANPEVAAAAVYDLTGAPVVVYQRNGSRAAPPRAPPSGARTQARSVAISTPVVEQGAALGSVYLATVPEPLGRMLARHSGLALLTVMAFVLLAVVTRATVQLQRRAAELVSANDRLTVEMHERARAEEALRQSQKMEALGQLTGGIAHDFNNLLQVVHGAFELIRRKPQDAKVPRWVENGLHAAERGASLTRQLLAFSRSQRLELKPFIVAELIRGMGDLLARTLGPDIDLAFELDEERAPVLSDRTQLELAVLNLAINARDAMAPGGRLTVSTRLREIGGADPELAPGQYVELRVSDTGPGMSPQVLDRAFDPFFTTKGVGKGTGLGLSQVYGVARQAGGVARIESRPGEGTTVSLFLRRSEATEAAEAAPAEPAPGVAILAPRPDLTVLVVDDEPQVRGLACDTLNMLGYRAEPAETGAAALDLVERAAPDVVIMDYAMPGMSGAEAAALLRRRRPDLPIIFASGYADTAAVEAAVGPGAVILRKPFNMDELARTVAAAVTEPAAS